MDILFREINKLGYRFYDGYKIVKDYAVPGVIWPKHLKERQITLISDSQHIEYDIDFIMVLHTRRIWFPVPFKKDRELINWDEIKHKIFRQREMKMLHRLCCQKSFY